LDYRRREAGWGGSELQPLSPAYQEKVRARFAELRQTHGDKIDAFFGAHPEYRLIDGS
jgi:hypothetical protein